MFKGTIDYILYSPAFFKLMSVLEMPDSDTLRAQHFLPSKRFPSDHLRIEAIFEFKECYGGRTLE